MGATCARAAADILGGLRAHAAARHTTAEQRAPALPAGRQPAQARQAAA